MTLSEKDRMAYAEQLIDGFGLDPNMIEYLLRFSETLGIGVWDVISNCLTDYFAKKHAESIFWEKPVEVGPAFEWRVSDDEKILIKGKELYDILFERYTWDCKRQYFLDQQKVPAVLKNIDPKEYKKQTDAIYQSLPPEQQALVDQAKANQERVDRNSKGGR